MARRSARRRLLLPRALCHAPLLPMMQVMAGIFDIRQAAAATAVVARRTVGRYPAA
jgi:hypothetical protein